MGGKAAVKALVLAVAWWALGASSAPGFSSSWAVYTNPRFGYTVDVPADFPAGEAPETMTPRTTIAAIHRTKDLRMTFPP